MSDIEEKVKCAGELAELDPYTFNDLSKFDPKVLENLKRIKKRIWMFIVYPESAPEDWIEKLKYTGIKFVVSPLHDKDIKKGKLLKPHYHLILCFDGPTTFLTAATYREITHGPYPKVCENLRGAYEYLTHQNDKDKAQYSESDIQTFNGFELDLSTKDVLKIKKELAQFIVEHKIKEYLVFDLYVQFFFEDQYYEVATANTYYFNSLCASYRYNPDVVEKNYEAILAELNKKTETKD